MNLHWLELTSKADQKVKLFILIDKIIAIHEPMLQNGGGEIVACHGRDFAVMETPEQIFKIMEGRPRVVPSQV